MTDAVDKNSPATGVPRRELLAKLIESRRITPHFQPVVDLFTGDLFGYELLSRGSPPFEDPEVMFHLAKEWGMTWDIEYACRTASLRSIAELGDGSSRYLLNVSPDIFSDPRFHGGFTLGAMRELGIDNRRIIIEITETATIDDYEGFERLVRHYVDQGFRIALDDFGIGHSGLSTLVTVSPHFLKLDRSIVAGIDRSSYKQNVVRSIVTFAANVESNVIAEGIETYPQLEALFRLGVRYGQGYLLGRPAARPAALEEPVLSRLRVMIEDYKYHRFALGDGSVAHLLTYPATHRVGSVTCEEMEDQFRRSHNLDHVVVLDGDTPIGLVTRQHFYLTVAGRYGYSIFQKRRVEEIAKRDFLVIKEKVDIRALGRYAMSRVMGDVYDPIVVVDDGGAFLGTVTMKQLLATAFDLEIKIATSLNPLTRLPGNLIIGYWLEEAFKRERYAVVYADLSRFKEYNDRYGFSSGDDLIRCAAQALADGLPGISPWARLGHIGGDDFVIVADEVPSEAVLAQMCAEFDRRRAAFFDAADFAAGFYASTDRGGRRVRVPLATLTLAVVSSENFDASPHPGRVAEIASALKRRSKQRGDSRSVSHYLFERRTYPGV